MTNFGKRHQISPGSGLAAGLGALPARGRDDRQHEGPDADPDVAADDLHQREGPHRLIAGAGDGAVAGKIAIGLRRGEAGRIGEFRGADPGAADAGRQMQRTGRRTAARRSSRSPRGSRVVMAIGASSFLAPTAPAMAIAAETPHTAPPAPSVAASRRSSPRRDRDPKDHEEGDDRDDRGLQDRHRPGPDDQRERQRRAQQHDAGLDVELDAEPGIEPARQADQVGRCSRPSDERHQRRLEIVGTGPVPLAEREDRDREHIEQRRRTARSRAPCGRAR